MCNYQSKVDGTKFYFIQDNNAYGEVTQRVQVKDVEVIPEIIPTTEGTKEVNVATAPVLMLPMVANPPL